jgi:hypothetical protein
VLLKFLKRLPAGQALFLRPYKGLKKAKQKLNIGGGTALAVEKVKPDPLNLTVNTVVGKRPCML